MGKAWVAVDDPAHRHRHEDARGDDSKECGHPTGEPVGSSE